jgi:hypothetical protein
MKCGREPWMKIPMKRSLGLSVAVSLVAAGFANVKVKWIITSTKPWAM